MAASGFTPILLYASGTATNVPSASNLTNSANGAELALNYADGKLFYKDSGGTVQVLASKAGNINVSSFSGGTTGLTPSTATTGVVTLGGTLNIANGGTGQTTASAAFNALSPITSTGDLIIGNGTNSATRLAIGTNGYVLTSNGTTASWAAATGGVTQIIAGTNVTISPSGGTGAVTINATGASSAYTRTSFTATAAQTTFSVTYTVGYIQVYLNGVLLNGTDYTATNGTSVVLAVGANAGDIVETVAYNTVAIGSSANLAGGSAGVVPYQSAAGTTSFSAAGTSGQSLLSGGTGSPTWGTPALASAATNVSGGAAGQVPYQTGSGATSFSAAGTSGQSLLSGGTGSPTWGTPALATAATNIAGGGAGQVPYNTGSGATSFLAAGTSGQVLTSQGTGAPIWSTPSGGAMVLISTQTASNSASLSFTGLSGYDKYFLVFENIYIGNSTQIYVQLGTGTGPTYITSGYYGGEITAYYLGGSRVNPTFNQYSNQFALNALNTQTGGPRYWSGNYYILGTNQTNTFYQGSATGVGFTSTNIVTMEYNMFAVTPGAVITAILIGATPSTITSGTVSLYGISS
jgi:hypothetical protein